MKKIRRTKQAALILLVLCIIAFTSSCSARKMKDYYSQSSNYITATGTISHIAYSDEKDVLYYGFSDIEYHSTPTYPYHFEYYGFKIVGKNFQIVQEQNIDDKIKMGDEVTFVAAPRYFYDGYAIPIVAISIGDEELLEFEEGVANLLGWLDQERLNQNLAVWRVISFFIGV